MATLACRVWVTACRNVKMCSRGISFSARRLLLSEAYSCHDAWNKRLESPILQHVSLGEFAVQLREKLEKQKRADVIDMDILANKLHEMDLSEVEFMEDLIQRFRQSPDAVPVRDSIVHAVVRAYIDLDLTDRLLCMMKDRAKYGIFPDSYATNILLDHFIKQGNFADAAQVSYEMMLQEDFSHPITFLLSLYATVKHLYGSSREDLAAAPPPEETGEEDWIPVKVIRFPYYDDHFDIKDERFILGKTLYMLGQRVESNDMLGQSLQIIGLGLYHKFGKGLLKLEEIASADKKSPVLEEALAKFGECLENAETRDPNEPEKDFGLRTMDDEIHKLRLTPEAKEELTTEFEETAHKLRWNDGVIEDSLHNQVESLVKSELAQYEAADIDAQVKMFEVWRNERQEMLQNQIREYYKKEKKEEIEKKLKELQEKEEMLRFFELRDQINMAKEKAPREKPPKEEEDPETLRAKRIARRKYRHHV